MPAGYGGEVFVVLLAKSALRKHVTPAPRNQCSTDQQQMLYLPRKQNLRRLSLMAQFTLIDSAS
jgi:hypothetical protein